MKILVYGLNYAPEPIGIGKFSGEMCAWLAARGHQVRVVTAPPYYPAWKVAEGHAAWRYRRQVVEGVRVLRCPLWVPKKRGGVKRLLHLMSFALTSLPVVLWQALAFRPAVVLAVAPALMSAPGAWVAARLGGLFGRGGKAWLHVQDFEVDAAFELGLLRPGLVRGFANAVERAILRRFDRVSSITPPMVERLAAKGVAAEKTCLFPNWADTAVVRPVEGETPGIAALRAEAGVAKGDLVALYAGNLGEKQGLETLVAAARALGEESAVTIVLCGEGAAAERLAGLAQGTANMRFLALQPVERLNDLLNLAHMHLLPQRADAADLVMPSKLGGMLASGRPVVAGVGEGSAIAGAIEGCGLSVPPDDGAAMAGAIRRLAGDAGARRRLGAAARAKALAEWEKEGVLTRFEAALLALGPGEG